MDFQSAFDFSTSEDLAKVCQLIHERTLLSCLKSDMWKDYHDDIIFHFLIDPSQHLLLLYIDKNLILHVKTKIPTDYVEEICYFLKTGNIEKITYKNISESLQYGTVKSDYLNNLLRQISTIYSPILLNNKSWPSCVKDDFTFQLHKFLANITDYSYQLIEKKVLYIPEEGQDLSVENATKDKELVQRLEGVVLIWVRQINDVLVSQGTASQIETTGPLEEIQFWKQRYADLTSISEQLQKSSVRHISAILEASKSSCLNQFAILSLEIKARLNEAANNLKFLFLLKEPCEKLASSSLIEIPAQLQIIFNLIRIIWICNPQYNNSTKITSLFRKLNNELMKRCCEEICLEKLFNMYAISTKKAVLESIDCCLKYKEIYINVSKLHKKFSPYPWDIDEIEIFASIDAFIQRCNDIIEICDCENQFGHWQDGKQDLLPNLGGQKGFDITKSLKEIEDNFMNSLKTLSKAKDSVFDIWSTSWHKHYDIFRNNIRDLEDKVLSVIAQSFDTVKTVSDGLEILKIFENISQREEVSHGLRKFVSEIYILFNKELEEVKLELFNKKVFLHPLSPKYSGIAHWACSLLQRIQIPMKELKEADWLLKSDMEEESLVKYQQVFVTLKDFIQFQYNQWCQVSEKEPLIKLKVPLMKRSLIQDGMLDLNFDSNIHKLIQEIYYWEQLKFEIPYFLCDINKRKGDFLKLRENVMIVIREYNRILFMLSPEEKGLFCEKIKSLDRKINPGVTRLTWITSEVLNYYIADCKNSCSKIKKIVDRYKHFNTVISNLLQTMSKITLVDINKSVIYSCKEFISFQMNFRMKHYEKILNIYEEIIQIIQNLYLVFQNDGSEVYSYWVSYVQQFDNLMAESLRIVIKSSLLILDLAVNGNDKNEINPLINVNVILENCKIEFVPSIAELKKIFMDIATNVIDHLDNFERLTHILNENKKEKSTFKKVVAKDEDCNRLLSNISNGFKALEYNKELYCKRWEEYSDLWNVNMIEFIKSFKERNPVAKAYDDDITRYTELMNNAQKEERIYYLQFLSVDSTPLKNSITKFCLTWKNELLKLLFEVSKEKLMNIHNFMDTNTEKLEKYPQSVNELQNLASLQKNLKETIFEIKQHFDPLGDNFRILDNYNYWIEPKLMKLLMDLNPKWEKFKICIENVECIIEKIKEIFKSNLLKSVTSLQNEISIFLEELLSSALFQKELSYQEALSKIDSIQFKIEILSKQQIKLYDELNVFNYKLPPLQEFIKLQRITNNLEVGWKIVMEWEENWNKWKKTSFLELDILEIEKQTHYIHIKLQDFLKNLDEKLEIIANLNLSISKFKAMIPIVIDLKNPAIRPRHWESIQNILGIIFDYSSSDFNLYEMTILEFDKYKQQITEIASAAVKELEIEKVIKTIKDLWESKTLTLMAVKNVYQLVDVDSIFHLADDNMMTINSIKHSPNAKPFRKELYTLEYSLSLMKEILEKVLQIQRKWNQLQNILISGNMRCLIPKEVIDFEELNHKWQIVTKKLYNEKKPLEIVKYPDFLNFLIEMNKDYELLENSLDSFLLTKRYVFPRFYFLSNNDLFEMLSEPKNEEILQLHIKKCFHGIKKLKFNKIHGSSTSETIGMSSIEEEYVVFSQAFYLSEKLEIWACNVEKAMQITLHKLLVHCSQLYKPQTSTSEDTNKKFENWLSSFPGQICILSFKILWTSACTRALMSMQEKGKKTTMQHLQKNQIKLLENLIIVLKTTTSNLIKEKTIGLLTVEIYAREVIEKLLKIGCDDPRSFEWLSQLRFYYEKETDTCVIKQTNAIFKYQYEYHGNYNHIIITPLTERCFITLTSSLHMFKGALIKGPEGIGKTETIKELAKILGNYTLIINCWEGIGYKSIELFLSSIVQNGAWCIFDEFYTIRKKVLLVVAHQIHSIYTALSQDKNMFVFEGQEINLKNYFGIFLTIHLSAYYGNEKVKAIPNNLKRMFRPVGMIFPDSSFIAEAILYVNGFSNCKALAKKVYALYNFSTHHLSRQHHYNFNLRSLVACLNYAIVKKREFPSKTDEEVLLIAITHLNTSILTSADLKIFNNIIKDLFPGVETSLVPYDKLEKAIHDVLKENKLQDELSIVRNILQLHQNIDSYQSIIICGNSGSGKSIIWKTLKLAIKKLTTLNIGGFYFIKKYILNPKVLTLNELFGEINSKTGIWTDGIISWLLRLCLNAKTEERWIIFDGPIDPSWIECMNSVIDENKVLTLINGERIPLSPQLYLLFEVDSLEHVNPSIVSKCGIIYTEYTNLSWEIYINSWLEQHSKEISDELNQIFKSFLSQILNFKKEHCEELVPISELNGIISLCKLLDYLITEYIERYALTIPSHTLLKLWFFFSVTWSVCASVNDNDCNKIDNLIRKFENSYPVEKTVYDYFVDSRNVAWLSWTEKLQDDWKYNSSLPFYRMIVPTTDTVKYSFLITMMLHKEHPVLLIGPNGCGKTLIMNHAINKLDPTKYSNFKINFSFQIKVHRIQKIIENRFKKKTKEIFIPQKGTKMIIFIDDLNMPFKDEFGYQPPLELIRMYLTYGFWYDCKSFGRKFLEGMLIVAAMNPSIAGETFISNRLQNCFLLINIANLQKNEIIHIFGSMLTQKLSEFGEHIKLLGNTIIQKTVDLFDEVLINFHPSPSHIHYIFNIRDIARVIEGLLCANKDYVDNLRSVSRLWIHECMCVFSDRLISEHDKELFFISLNDKLGSLSNQSLNNLCPNKRYPILCNFMNKNRIYMEIEDQNLLSKFLQNSLEHYNNMEFTSPMNIILFEDSIKHICRICRVLHHIGGNILLMGSGGIGKQSLSKISAYVCGYSLFQIKPSETYKQEDFHKDLKVLFNEIRTTMKPKVFLFLDNQILEDIFMEDINDILCTGIIPDLYTFQEEEEMLISKFEENALKPLNYSKDSPYYFGEMIKNNLHLILCMNPVGSKFRQRIRNYPSLINYCTINWFSDWPQDILATVATKYLSNIYLDKSVDEMKQKLANLFPLIHNSVVKESKRMEKEFKRTIYITPTNYLQMLSNFVSLSSQKRQSLSDEIDKISIGLDKINEASIKVQKMTTELDSTKEQANEYLKQCKSFRLNLIKENFYVKEQQKLVIEKGERIEEEERTYDKMRNIVLRDLNVPITALNEALESLDKLDKKDIDEIKNYTKPPLSIEKVMEAIMIFRGLEESWNEAKKQLGEENFIQQLKNYDPDRITDKMLWKISKYIALPEFNPNYIGKISNAARSLCMWVLAMENYGQIYRIVEPKRIRVKAAEDALKQKQQTLKEEKENLEKLKSKIEELTRQFELKVKEKEQLEYKAKELEKKLSSASLLVDELISQRICWNNNNEELKEKMKFIIGDSLLSSACLSYLGPFLHDYRDNLLSRWTDLIQSHNLDYTNPFNFSQFVTTNTVIQEWTAQGLPTDNYSIDNAIIITHSSNWPFIIDPQYQAVKWIINLEKHKDLKIINEYQKDFFATLEFIIQEGKPAIFQVIKENINPALDSLLRKAIIPKNNGFFINFNGKYIPYNPDFKLYIATKIRNPNFIPEIFSKTTIINFGILNEGLETHLLGITIRKERPDLEDQKKKLNSDIMNGRENLRKLNNEILQLLRTTKGELLDDQELIKTLEDVKYKIMEINDQLATTERAEIKINTAIESYHPAAHRSTILFFILNEMNLIEPMYQFNLDEYIDLFILSIDKAPRDIQLKGRIHKLNEYHTFAVYRYADLALLEKHKLLFSFRMCIKLMEDIGNINKEEYSFFLTCGIVNNRKYQVINSCPKWLPHSSWDNISELDNLSNFRGILASFEQISDQWFLWYNKSDPENHNLPGEWEHICNKFQKILIIRCLRNDRIISCVREFVSTKIGDKFIEPSYESGYVFSSPTKPLIFILSSEIDPSDIFEKEIRNHHVNLYEILSMDENKSLIAEQLIEEGLKMGKWIFLSNCDNCLNWMPKLDKIIENIPKLKYHDQFRLWLSSSPHKDFPISLLQKCVKITVEQPKGIRNNMSRIYSKFSEIQFKKSENIQDRYASLLFCLSLFHSIILERRYFKSFGWNVLYNFNDSDFEFAENILLSYLEQYEKTPWDALKYFIGDIIYGGHITDEWDKRLIHVYINQYFSSSVLSGQNYKLFNLPISSVGNLASYQAYINFMPYTDKPEIFGVHPNATISTNIQETEALLDKLLCIHPGIRSIHLTKNKEELVMERCSEILAKLPNFINEDNANKLIERNISFINIALIHEIENYNKLLDIIIYSLKNLKCGLKGERLISDELEEVYNNIYERKVPQIWQKNLGSWIEDLIKRIFHFDNWIMTSHPPIKFWLSAFTLPKGFLISVLQDYSKINKITFDTLSWDFVVSAQEERYITESPEEGIYVIGIYIEGASWDYQNYCLIESQPMQLIHQFPVINMKPIKTKKIKEKGLYVCPCYYYPNRMGTYEFPSFVIAIIIKCGEMSSEHWIKRGTAFLLNLDV